MHIIAVFLIVHRRGAIEPFTDITLKSIYCFLVLALMHIYSFLACLFQEGCCWAGFLTSFGKRVQIRLGSICQNGLDDMHIFGMQVRVLLQSSKQVSARVCEANSLYYFPGSFYDKYGQKVKCK